MAERIVSRMQQPALNAGYPEGRTAGSCWRTGALYLLPALMDMVLSIVLFVGTVRTARLTHDTTRSACILAVWSLVYVLACPVVGRLISPARAPRFVLAGCLLCALTCGLLALASGFAPMLILIGLVGVGMSLFFPAFQLLMKEMDGDGGLSVAHSVGLYTFAWSTGFACGPFVSGFLMQAGSGTAAGGESFGWRLAFLFGSGICLLMAIILSVVVRGRRQHAPVQTAAQAPDETRYAGMPDLAWLGWLGAGVGFVSLAMLRSIFPVRAVGTECHISAAMLGTIFFVLSIVQAVVGLMLKRSRYWMYRPLPVAGFAVVGLAGLLCFAFGVHPLAFLIGAGLFGIYSGSFCFYLVFHALVHPNRAGRYVAVNEALVGLTGFLAPLAGGALADHCGSQYPYLVVAALTVAVTVLQICVHRARPGNLSTSLEQTL